MQHLGESIPLYHGKRNESVFLKIPSQKEIHVTSQPDKNIVILSSKTYVFEDKLTKY